MKCASNRARSSFSTCVRLRQVLARCALALDQVGHRVHAKAVDAEIQPKLHDRPDRFANCRIVVVQVRLVAEEPVPVVGLRDRVPGPVRELGVEKDEANAAIAIVGLAPHVPVPTRIVRRAARFDEPRVLIRRVIQDELDDHAQPARVRLLQECLELLERAIARMDVRIIGNVVPIVPKWRWIHGLDPEAVDAERREMVQLGRQPDEVADAVSVAVRKRLDVQLIEDRVLVPEGVGGSGDRHKSFYATHGPRALWYVPF